jgi:hypothetical protein
LDPEALSRVLGSSTAHHRIALRQKQRICTHNIASGNFRDPFVSNKETAPTANISSPQEASVQFAILFPNPPSNSEANNQRSTAMANSDYWEREKAKMAVRDLIDQHNLTTEGGGQSSLLVI